MTQPTNLSAYASFSRCLLENNQNTKRCVKQYIADECYNNKKGTLPIILTISTTDCVDKLRSKASDLDKVIKKVSALVKLGYTLKKPSFYSYGKISHFNEESTTYITCPTSETSFRSQPCKPSEFSKNIITCQDIKGDTVSTMLESAYKCWDIIRSSSMESIKHEQETRDKEEIKRNVRNELARELGLPPMQKK